MILAANMAVVFGTLSLLLASIHLHRQGAPSITLAFLFLYFGILVIPGLLVADQYSGANSVLRQVSTEGFIVGKFLAATALLGFSFTIFLVGAIFRQGFRQINFLAPVSNIRIRIFNYVGLGIPVVVAVIAIMLEGFPQAMLFSTFTPSELLSTRTSIHNQLVLPSFIFRGLGEDLAVFTSFSIAAQYASPKAECRPTSILRLASLIVALYFLTHNLAKSPAAIYFVFYCLLYVTDRNYEQGKKSSFRAIVAACIGASSLLIFFTMLVYQSGSFSFLLSEISKRIFLSQISPYFFVAEMYANNHISNFWTGSNQNLTSLIHLPGFAKTHISQVLTSYLFSEAWSAGTMNHLSTFFLSDLLIVLREYWFIATFLIFVNVGIGIWSWQVIRPKWFGIAFCAFVLHASNIASAAAPMILSSRVVFLILVILTIWGLLHILPYKNRCQDHISPSNI